MSRILLSAFGLLVLSGCADGSASAPIVLPQPTASVGVPGTPAALATGESKVAAPGGGGASSVLSADDRKVAERAVERWWAIVNSASSGDATTSELRSVSARGCAYCSEFEHKIDALLASGSRSVGAAYKVRELVTDNATNEVAAVSVVVEPQDVRLVDTNGQVVRTIKGEGSIEYVFSVARSGDSWLIQDVLNLGPVR
ncbi:hypothetical protein [Vallicoccus soli]|uniref:hypothetical protein n=1 Tax=Vallicoccus soli TaxID=2339232 RepID=UPI001059CE66|nr:hypothetical protein [Vallicoccus soli]